MPTKNFQKPSTGPSLVVEDVFKVAELAQLAEDWTTPGATFEAPQLAEYQKLCSYFGVDGTSLLFATQTRTRDAVRLEADATTTMPVVGDLPESPSEDDLF